MCLRALDRFCRSASGLQLHIFAISSFSYPSISFSWNTCCCRGGRWSTICCISSMSSFPSVHSCSAASSLGRLLSAHSIFLCRQWSIATPLIIFIANASRLVCVSNFCRIAYGGRFPARNLRLRHLLPPVLQPLSAVGYAGLLLFG